MATYYEILEVDKNSTPEQIKKSYKILALKWHPDKNSENKLEAEKKFKELSEAYRTLNNPEFRASYDARGEDWKESLIVEDFSLEENLKRNKEKKFREKIEETISLIFSKFISNPQVEEVDLDSSLWENYSDWLEKVQSMKDSDSLFVFEKQLIDAIQQKSKEKENDSLKWEAIERIEKKLEWNKEELTINDLRQENRNYQEEIMNVVNDEIHWKLTDIANRVKENIDELIKTRSTKNNNNIDVSDSSLKVTYNNDKKISVNRSSDSGILSNFNPMNWLGSSENKKNLVKINAQQWLEKNYPKEWIYVAWDEILNCWRETLVGRSEVKKLNIDKQNLNGILDLSDFTELRWLECQKNQLTKIILPNNNKLEVIYADNNFLTTFDYTKLNPQTLIWLDVVNNNLEPISLDVFNDLVNLEGLLIGNLDKEKIFSQVAYNRFFGSLESLKKMNKLKTLEISNTNIDRGLEYLPESLEKITISSWWIEKFSCWKIADQLSNRFHNHNYNYRNTYSLINWRRVNPWIWNDIKKNIDLETKIIELERENKELKKKLEEETQNKLEAKIETSD
ncbi:MAG: DnaJ domain-containing protein [Spiroplasmataceae bacterium]|nr:DnaJ domain-containing protein [Spiroplasmataceae bacterium]